MTESTVKTEESHEPTLLLVDDDEVFRTRLAQAFERRGFAVRQAATGADGLALAEQDSPEFAVVDLRMPGMGGLEVVQALHGIDAATTIVVLTGYGSIATAVEAVKLGATHYVAKPADVDDLLAAFARREGVTEAEMHDPGQVPSLARVEWEHIQRVMSDCGGNITHAAEALGLHRRTLQRKLSKYPVSR